LFVLACQEIAKISEKFEKRTENEPQGNSFLPSSFYLSKAAEMEKAI